MMHWLKHFEKVRSRVESNKELWSVLYLGVLVYGFTILIVDLAFLSAPFTVNSDNPLLFGIGVLSYNYGHILNNCHQLPERSIFINNIQLPMCARCIGTNLGCLIGLLAPFYIRPRKGFIFSIWFAGILMTPLVVDGVSQTILHLRESNNTLRFFTGLSFGIGMVFYATGKIIHYAGRNKVDYRRLNGTSKIVYGFFMVVVLIGSLAAGFFYTSNSQALMALTAEHPNAVVSGAGYIPPNALRSIIHDPYIDRYDDSVLRDMMLLRGYGRNGYWLFTVFDFEDVNNRIFKYKDDSVRYYVDVSTREVYVFRG